MEELINFFRNLFDTPAFPTQWQSNNWSGFYGVMHILSDLLIWAAFLAIPIIIVRFIIARKKKLTYNVLYILFAAFILTTGFCHLIDAFIFMMPVFKLSAFMKAITAALSWVTVFVLLRILPAAILLKTPQELVEEQKKRMLAEAEAKKKNIQLQEAEKIGKICYGEWEPVNNNIVMTDFGYVIYELSNKSHFTLNDFISYIHPDDKEELRRIIKNIEDGDNVEAVIYRIILPSGKQKHVRIEGEVIFNAQGEISKFIGTLQDVTEQQAHRSHIEAQSVQLQDIAWIQSHKVRGPVATVLGLINLLQETDLSEKDKEMVIEGIKAASVNLDDVVKEIVAKSESVPSSTFKEPVDYV
jgi:PAS domain S-box-containing protein